MNTAKLSRIRKEINMLANDPGPGISAWLVDDNLTKLQGQILGPQDSPYYGGVYILSIDIPDRYPFEPPRVRFLTPIYHPNIDSDGRICLDTLKTQPQGSWSPSININTLLLTIRLLMSNPNANDGLVLEITEEYVRDIIFWRKKAADHARIHAFPKVINASSESISDAHQNIIGSDTKIQASSTVEESTIGMKRPFGSLTNNLSPGGDGESSDSGSYEDEESDGDDDDNDNNDKISNAK